jgi:hypothetical protein
VNVGAHTKQSEAPQRTCGRPTQPTESRARESAVAGGPKIPCKSHTSVTVRSHTDVVRVVLAMGCLWARCVAISACGGSMRLL